MKNIAVAVDFDEEALDVIELAASLAQRYESHLHLVHIYDQHPELTPYMYPGGAIEREVEFQKEAEKVQQFVSELEERGISASGYIKGGQPVKGLLEFAEHRDAELIVIGSHRKNRVEDVVLGSVANGVVRASRIPVLIVPRKEG